MKRLTIALCTCLLATPAFAAGKVTLRNCVAGDMVTTQEITITLARRTQRGGKPEDAVLKLRSRLRRMHLSESNPGSVKVADLLVSKPAEVVTVRRDGKPVEPLPKAETFNVPIVSTQLYTKLQTLQEGPAVVPLTRSVERAAATLLLDVAHWPRETVDMGHRWSRAINSEDFSGTQSFELMDATTIAGEQVLVIDARVEGKFIGPLATRYAFDKAHVRFMWSRGQRVLMQLQGKTEYRRLRDGGSDAQALSAEVRLMRRDTLDDEQQSQARRALSDFALASSEYHAGHYDKAVAACAAYREKWPESVWMPAVEDVERHAMDAAQPKKRMSRDELVRVFTQQVVLWQAALKARDDDGEIRARTIFENLVRTEEKTAQSLLKDKDEAVRALGMFAWSFGESPDHMVPLVDAVDDPSPKVRAFVAMGLAARADPLTEPDALRRLMRDSDATVRARACAAVARCNPPGEPIAGRLRDYMHQATKDADATTRREAARTFGAIGGPADIEPLRATLEDEKEPSVREAMVAALRQMEARNKK